MAPKPPKGWVKHSTAARFCKANPGWEMWEDYAENPPALRWTGDEWECVYPGEPDDMWEKNGGEPHEGKYQIRPPNTARPPTETQDEHLDVCRALQLAKDYERGDKYCPKTGRHVCRIMAETLIAIAERDEV